MNCMHWSFPGRKITDEEERRLVVSGGSTLPRRHENAMKHLSNLSVAGKLYAGFGLVLALLAAVLAVGLSGISSLARDTHRITDVSDVKLTTGLQLKFQAADLNGWENAYVLDHGKSRSAYQQADA